MRGKWKFSSYNWKFFRPDYYRYIYIWFGFTCFCAWKIKLKYHLPSEYPWVKTKYEYWPEESIDEQRNFFSGKCYFSDFVSFVKLNSWYLVYCGADKINCTKCSAKWPMFQYHCCYHKWKTCDIKSNIDSKLFHKYLEGRTRQQWQDLKYMYLSLYVALEI